MSAGDCKFCAVVTGALDAQVVHETDVVVAFLDHRPVFHGHTLVVPRDHADTLLDLAPDLVEPFFLEVQRMAAAVPAAMGAEGTFVAINNVISQSVPHLHAHVVPRRPKDGLRGFFWPRHKYESEGQLREVATKVRDATRRLAS